MILSHIKRKIHVVRKMETISSVVKIPSVNTLLKISKIPYLLIVEDNDFQLQTLLLIVNHLNYKFEVAKNGMMAIDTFKQKVNQNMFFTLILMDICMPIMGGCEATEIIRKYEETNNLKRTYICGITADKGEKIEAKIVKSGMDNVLKKPVNAIILNEIINSVMAKS